MTDRQPVTRPLGSRPPKIVMVFHEEALGGASLAVLRVVPLLERAGWTFAFWAPRGGGLEAALETGGYRHRGDRRLLRYSWQAAKMPPGPLSRLRSVPGYLAHYARFLRAEAPTLVHANTMLTIPEALIARAYGYPTVLHVHEMLTTTSRGLVGASLARCAHTVITPSAATQEPLRRAGVPSTVVNYGLDLAPARGKRGEAPRRLVVGTVGTISRRKGSDVFLEAARRVRELHPEAEFRMIGPAAPGLEEAWARKLLTEAERSQVITGVRQDVLRELSEWDVFVMPSREDPFPLAVLEAMSAGLPVVASRTGGIPEQLANEAGVLVEPGDVDALAAALVRLLSESDTRARLGAAGRRRIARDLTPTVQATELDRLYRATVAAVARRRTATEDRDVHDPPVRLADATR